MWMGIVYDTLSYGGWWDATKMSTGVADIPQRKVRGRGLPDLEHKIGVTRGYWVTGGGVTGVRGYPVG